MTFLNKIWAGVGAAAAFVVVWLWGVNALLRAELAEERTHNTLCMMANDTFAAQVAKQNDAVEKVKAAALKREKAARENEAVAQERARGFLAAAEVLRKIKMQGNACKDAESLFNAYLRGMK